MGSLQCIVVTPEATVFEGPADFVAVPLYDGELGVAPGRSPLIGRLGYGELRIREEDHTGRFYVDGGFVEVANNVVSVLTNRAIPAEKLDPQVVNEQLQTARIKQANSPELMLVRDRQVAQARAQLRVASKNSGNSAGH